MGRPKLNKTELKANVKIDTPKKIKKMALELGYQWGTNGNTGAFLDALSNVSVEEIKKLLNSDHI